MSLTEIKKALSLLYEPGEVFEARMLPKGNDKVHSGYFNEPYKCAEVCFKMNGIPEGIYTTINPCKPELLARACNRIEPQKSNRGNSTTEADILKRKWLMFDVDAIRPSGISSSDAEHDLAIKTAYELAQKLKEEMGFPDAVIGDSGNGAHIEYRIDLPNTKEIKEILESFFKVITEKYNKVSGIDIQTFADANRIWKLKGTLVCKGDNLQDRPHRESKLLQVPEQRVIIPLDFIQKIANEYKDEKKEKPKDANRKLCGICSNRTALKNCTILHKRVYFEDPACKDYDERIFSQGSGGKRKDNAWTPDDLEKWIISHGGIVEKTKKNGNTTHFILKTCLNNPEHQGHKEADAHINEMGVIGYKCHHSSCKNVTWVMIREKLDPEYKEKKEAYANREYKKNGAFDYIDQITEKNPIYYDTTGQFWLWYDEGFYKQADITEIMLLLLRDIADPSIIKSGFKGELLEAAKIRGRDAQVKPVPNNWIHLQNGVYDIKTEELSEATPNYLFTDPIPHKITNSEDTPTIDKLFSEWVTPEKVPLLNEIAAYCLYNGYPIHRMFVLIGRGRNGKGQYRDFVVNLVGRGNRTASTLEQLINSRFETARLFNKKICTMGEINYTLLDRTAILKMLSGGDPIPGEMKNKSPFEFVNTAKLLINTNSLPQTSDKTDAFYFRCIVIEFGKQFLLGKDIIETIPEWEYDNFLTKSLRVLNKLLERGTFTNEGDILDKEREYEKLSNPLNEFINAYYVRDPNGKVAAWRLLERFIDYCKEKGYRKPQSKTEFNNMLKVNYEVEKKNAIDDEDIDEPYKNWVWVFGIKSKDLENKPKDDKPKDDKTEEEQPQKEKPQSSAGDNPKENENGKKDLPVLPVLPKVYLKSPIGGLSGNLGKTGKTGKKPSQTTELIKLLTDISNNGEHGLGTINNSNINKFTYWFTEKYKPFVDSADDKDGIRYYLPLEIKAIASRVFKLTPEPEAKT